MKIEELISFCSDVRRALEMADAEGIHDEMTALGMSDFPAGCCGDTTDILAFLINKQFGELALRRSGVYKEHLNADSRLRDGNSHAWLELSGNVIDLTADQFNDRGFENPSVMITSDHSFHDLFASRDSRYNLQAAVPPSINPRLGTSIWYVTENLSRLDGDLITVRMRHYDEPTHGDSNKKPPEGGFIVSRGV